MDDKPTAGLRDLFEAVHGDEDDAVVRLLRAGAPAEATDEDGTTVLYEAAVNDRRGMVRLLLAAGADPDRPSGPSGGDLPLCAAAVGGHAEVVRTLLVAGARPDLREDFGFTALAWAAGRGHAATAEVLLAHGADPDLPGPGGEPPLVLAARRGSPATVRVLLRHRAAAREAALAEARWWLENDVADALRAGLRQTYGARDGDEFVAREVVEEGGTTVVVELLRGGRPVAVEEQQTGHAAVVTRLECVLGIETPLEVLAERAVRSGSPEGNDWRESVAALWQRADVGTLRAASGWCAESSSSLHQTFAADVLARAVPAAQAVPLLRELARREGPAHLTRAAIRALGRHADPSALPEVVGRAGHGDAGVRERVARALGRYGSAAPAEALIALTRDEDLGVRRAAVVALSRAGADTAKVRDVLAEQVGAVAEGGAPREGPPPCPPFPKLSASLKQGRPHSPPGGGPAAQGAWEQAFRGAGNCATSHDAPARRPPAPQATRVTNAPAPLSPADPAYAEAARGLAVRQDPRAAEALLRVLSDGGPDGAARAVAVAALDDVRDEALRLRLEWTSPRIR
ncbi:ankyrin repeat domain-containing protein [Streptomyces sp. NPDC021093]|uniref:ankyrin repeat domain-containing protein n=1 Tax=Streptomyces sp. NPDC021093 TaxID=3365112 RepID=UPI0037AD9559